MFPDECHYRQLLVRHTAHDNKIYEKLQGPFQRKLQICEILGLVVLSSEMWCRVNWLTITYPDSKTIYPSAPWDQYFTQWATFPVLGVRRTYITHAGGIKIYHILVGRYHNYVSDILSLSSVLLNLSKWKLIEQAIVQRMGRLPYSQATGTTV
jgi:hypothetical protein